MTSAPAFVRDEPRHPPGQPDGTRSRHDVSGAARPANLARFAFLDPTARDFSPDWHDIASRTVAELRGGAGLTRTIDI
jgi:hypothetical protein